MAGGESGRRGRLALVVLLFGSIIAAGRLVPAVRWSREPKVGLLDFVLRRFDPEVCDILFVPVGVNYDWVLEDHSLLQPERA